MPRFLVYSSVNFYKVNTPTYSAPRLRYRSLSESQMYLPTGTTPPHTDKGPHYPDFYPMDKHFI